MKRKRGSKKRVQEAPFQIRMTGDLAGLADIVVRLASDAAGLEIKRTAVLRSAMIRGLEAMQDELLAKAAQKSRASR